MIQASIEKGRIKERKKESKEEKRRGIRNLQII
jgi:hypothetical protein